MRMKLARIVFIQSAILNQVHYLTFFGILIIFKLIYKDS
jgi:hypothetical protein